MKTRTKTPAYVTASVRFPGELYARVKAEAVKKGLSVSDIVRLSLMDALSAAPTPTK